MQNNTKNYKIGITYLSNKEIVKIVQLFILIKM